MTERGNELHPTADRQISELLGFISTLDEARAVNDGCQAPSRIQA
jgi:hypothetical protein